MTAGSERRLMSVSTGLVLETLVGSIGAEVSKLIAADRGVHPALVGGSVPSFGADAALSGALARRGYLARIVELELFEPANAPTPGLRDALEKLTAEGSGLDEAVASHSLSVAAGEPLARPSPEDGAFAWRVPGPGGHVRHYVAAQAIAELVREPGGDATGELKRAWTYGFCVRCCEDALPAESAPPTGA